MDFSTLRQHLTIMIVVFESLMFHHVHVHVYIHVYTYILQSILEMSTSQSVNSRLSVESSYSGEEDSLLHSVGEYSGDSHRGNVLYMYITNCGSTLYTVEPL